MTSARFSPTAQEFKLVSASLAKCLDVSERREANSDEYFDDAHGMLWKNGCSLRHRADTGRHLVTFKRVQEGVDEFGLTRFEKEVVCEDLGFGS